jgi:signal transduction histidine kinase
MEKNKFCLGKKQVFIWAVWMISLNLLQANNDTCSNLNWKKLNDSLILLNQGKEWQKVLATIEEHSTCFNNVSNALEQIKCFNIWSQAYFNTGNFERVFYVQDKMFDFVKNKTPRHYYLYLVTKMHNLQNDPKADMFALYKEAKDAAMNAEDHDAAMQAQIALLLWLKQKGEIRRAYDLATEALKFQENHNLSGCDILWHMTALMLELKTIGLPKASQEQIKSYTKRTEECMLSGNQLTALVTFYMEISVKYGTLGLKQQAADLIEKGYEISKELPLTRTRTDIFGKYVQLKMEMIEDVELRELLMQYTNERGLLHIENHYAEIRLFSTIMGTSTYRQEAVLQKSIAELKEKALVQSQNNNNLLLSIMIVLALLVIALTAVFFLFRSRMRHKQAVRIKEQELSEIRAHYQGELMERERVAKDLHDSVGSVLVAARMHFQIGKKQEAEILLNQAIGDVRSISHNLKPVYLEDQSLVIAIKKLCEQWGTETLNIQYFQIGEEEALPPALKEPVYRIYQELLFNAMKHAQPENIIVQLQLENEMLTLIVEDDGKGFVENTEPGIGLLNIKSRLKQLGGEIEILSTPGKGTSISIGIPMKTLKIYEHGTNTVSR